MWADLRGSARLCRKANALPKSRNPDCYQQIGVSGSGAIGTRARQCTALGVIVEPSRPCCHASDVGARFKRLEAPTSPDPQQVGPEWQDEEPHTSHCVEAKAETHCGKSADFELSDVTALPGLWPPKSEATDRPASTSQGAEPKAANFCRLGRSYAPLLAPSLSANTYRVHRDQVEAAQRTCTASPSRSLDDFYLIRGEAPPPP